MCMERDTTFIPGCQKIYCYEGSHPLSAPQFGKVRLGSKF